LSVGSVKRNDSKNEKIKLPQKTEKVLDDPENSKGKFKA